LGASEESEKDDFEAPRDLLVAFHNERIFIIGEAMRATGIPNFELRVNELQQNQFKLA
jgi:hypothetical protein